MFYRPLKFLFVFLLGLLFVPAMTIPPEGAFRDGAFSTTFLCWFLLLPLAMFLVVQGGTTGWSSGRRTSLSPKDDAIPLFAVGGTNRFCFADTVAIAFISWITFSLVAMVARDGGNWRYAINSFSLYFFLVYVYFLIRVSRSVFSPVLLLTLFAAMAVMCMTESFSALYAYFIRDPAFRQSWMQNSNELLRNSGMFYPEGSPERILLENRILGSSEPLGTYGLANTLAGVLIPILVAIPPLVCLAMVSVLRRSKTNTATPLETDAQNPAGNGLSPKLFMSFMSLAAIVFVPLFLVLILTKSRTGILAFLFGCFLFVAALVIRRWFVEPVTTTSAENDNDNTSHATNHRGGSSLFLFGIAVILMVGASVFLAFRLNVIDREVFTEAEKSLGYRLDYWRSSSAMIADYPWFGIGPGSFQTRYPSYMMPLASEVIADPHNFVFELAAMFGLPALILFLLFFVLGCPIPFLSKVNRCGWFTPLETRPTIDTPDEQEVNVKYSARNNKRSKSRRLNPSTASVATSQRDDLPSITPEMEAKFFFTGLGLGFFLAFIFSFFTSAPFGVSFLVCGLIAFILVVPLFGSLLSGICKYWVQNPQTTQRILRTILLCMCGAILLNFCAAGGFSYPPTALPLWLCLAVLVNDSMTYVEKPARTKQQKTIASTPAWAYGAFPLFLAIPVVFYFFIFLPASRGEAFVRDCRDKLIRENQPQQEILNEYPQSMEKADLYSIPVAQLYFEIAASAYAQVPNHRTYSYWQQTRQHLLKIAPLSSSIYETVGAKEIELSKEFNADKLLPQACDTLKDAARLAPFDAKKHALWTIALDMTGKHDEAIRSGRKSLELDEATPHLDRKLTKNLREQIEKIVNTTSK